MARLTEAERAEIRHAAARVHREPTLPDADRFVAPTPEARLRYLRWIEALGRLAADCRPAVFRGNRWRL